MIRATVVDVDALLRTIWHAALAGVGISIIFAVAVYGTTRSMDMRRDGRSGAAGAFAAVGVLGTLAALGAVVYAVFLITDR